MPMSAPKVHAGSRSLRPRRALCTQPAHSPPCQQRCRHPRLPPCALLTPRRSPSVPTDAARGQPLQTPSRFPATIRTTLRGLGTRRYPRPCSTTPQNDDQPAAAHGALPRRRPYIRRTSQHEIDTPSPSPSSSPSPRAAPPLRSIPVAPIAQRLAAVSEEEGNSLRGISGDAATTRRPRGAPATFRPHRRPSPEPQVASHDPRSAR